MTFALAANENMLLGAQVNALRGVGHRILARLGAHIRGERGIERLDASEPQLERAVELGVGLVGPLQVDAILPDAWHAAADRRAILEGNADSYTNWDNRADRATR
jgi:hypothetical protein